MYTCKLFLLPLLFLFLNGNIFTQQPSFSQEATYVFAVSEHLLLRIHDPYYVHGVNVLAELGMLTSTFSTNTATISILMFSAMYLNQTCAPRSDLELVDGLV